MVNFYQLLGVGVHAPTQTIATIIKLKRLQNQIPVEVLDKAEVWLLNTEMRVRYDAKLRQKHPDVFMHAAVEPRHVAAPIQAEAAPKRRKIGRWYLLGLIGVLVMVWWVVSTPFFGIAKPASWQAIGLEDLQTDAHWHQTSQALYLTEQHEQPQWLWVWQKEAGLSLMPVNDKTPALCEVNTVCKVAIQVDQEPVQRYELQASEHGWSLKNPADDVSLALRLQQAKQLTITWPAQERPAVFQAGAFPSDFLIDALPQ